MDRPEQEDEQGLREVAGERRSLHVRSDESPDDEETSTLLRLFGQFQKGTSRKSTFTIFYSWGPSGQTAPRFLARRIEGNTASSGAAY
jgi:hypothetical protein